MRKLKPFKVRIVTTDEWAGALEASSRSEAKRLAAEQFKAQERNTTIKTIQIIKEFPWITRRLQRSSNSTL